jgi:hypothetical protein
MMKGKGGPENDRSFANSVADRITRILKPFSSNWVMRSAQMDEAKAQVALVN